MTEEREDESSSSGDGGGCAFFIGAVLIFWGAHAFFGIQGAAVAAMAVGAVFIATALLGFWK